MQNFLENKLIFIEEAFKALKNYLKENTSIIENNLVVKDLKSKMTNGNLLITKNSLNNKIKIAKNVVLEDVKIVLNGQDNKLIIEENSKLYDCSIYAKGNNNFIYIGKNCKLQGTYIMCMDDDNSINLNDNCTTNGKFRGDVHLHTMESTHIKLGCNCMLSGNITIRTTDGHSIINRDLL